MPLFDREGKSFDSLSLHRKSMADLQSEGIISDVPGLFIDTRDEAGNQSAKSTLDGVQPIDAILLSHAHLDHCGLLSHTRPEIPIYTSVGTSKMMLAGSIFAKQIRLPRERFRKLDPDKPTQIGDITITSFPVEHSIFGCLATLIEADGKSVLYTGDVRLHGRNPGVMKAFVEKLCGRTIDAVIMEGTHFGFPDGDRLTECEIDEKIVNLIANSRSLTLASFSPQNVDRLICFMRAAEQTNRTLVVDVYTAFIMHLLQREMNSPHAIGTARVFYPKVFKNSYRRRKLEKIKDLFVDYEIGLEEIRANPGNFLMMFRPSMLDMDFNNQLPQNTLCIYSRWKGYLEQQEWKDVRNVLDQCEGSLEVLHTSGHIFSDDIVSFVKSIAPKSIIPIHTFEPHKFAKQFENVWQVNDGVEFELE
jgi:ribonuclease J